MVMNPSRQTPNTMWPLIIGMLVTTLVMSGVNQVIELQKYNPSTISID